ncbi:MAG: CinA family nicotinamide mononucleotide deamidase-related protein [Bacteroidota bacterium]
MAEVGLISIGSELLSGRITNTNATFIGAQLKDAGFRLRREMAIPDTKEDILAALKHFTENFPIVLMTGGLGPTRDDITKNILAEFTGGKMVVHPPTLEKIKAIAAKFNFPLTDGNVGMAYVPDSCIPILNRVGAAPGMIFEQDDFTLISMPGVPAEMYSLMTEDILPYLKQKFQPSLILQKVIRTTGLAESKVEEDINHILEQFSAHLSIAFLPRIDGLWIELTARGRTEQREELEEELTLRQQQIEEVVKEGSYTTEDELLEKILGEALLEKGLTIGVAESLTGGKLAMKIVSISGASRYFTGSVTAYDTRIKEEVLEVPASVIEAHTVVSEEVASLMAEGVRKLLGTDIGLATTGYAEKQDDMSPHAWIGYADYQGSQARKVQMYQRRNTNIDKVVAMTMIECLKNIRLRFVSR